MRLTDNATLHALHGGEAIVSDGLVMSAGIDHRGAQFFMFGKALNGSDAATGVTQLRGGLSVTCRVEGGVAYKQTDNCQVGIVW